MRQFLILCALMAFTLSAIANDIDPIFDSLQWQANVIVVTGPEDDPLYIEQMELFTYPAVIQAMNQRDIIVLRFEDRFLGPIEELSTFPYKTRIVKKRNQHRYLQRQLETDDDVFSIVFVAKDGLTKQVWGEVTSPVEILRVIDQTEIVRPAPETETERSRRR